jgi:3-phenylpropionate/trans-cinnamate dioxygenase ferredoxin subunit
VNEKEFTWHKIAEHIDEIQLAENNIGVVEVKDKTVCIAKFQNRLFAFAHKCPHASGFFIDGYTDGIGNVICPVHGYKYDIRTGRNVSGEGYYLKNWPVDVRKDGVFVGLEKQVSDIS